jgi:hypothetical protein
MISRDGGCDLSIYPPSPGGCDDWDRREAVYPFILTTKSQEPERPSLRFLNRWGIYASPRSRPLETNGCNDA